MKITLEFINESQVKVLHGLFAAQSIICKRQLRMDEEKNCIENMLIVEAELIKSVPREEIIFFRKMSASIFDLSDEELTELLKAGLR